MSYPTEFCVVVSAQFSLGNSILLESYQPKIIFIALCYSDLFPVLDDKFIKFLTNQALCVTSKHGLVADFTTARIKMKH